MNANDYSEVYGIIFMLGNSYIIKLPKFIIEEIESKRNRNYVPEYPANIINELDNLIISQNAIEYINQLNIKYWNS